MSVISRQVSASSDDGMQNGPTVILNGTTILVPDYSTMESGIRFTDITVPKDSIIDSANIQLYIHSTNWAATMTGLRIYGVDADNWATWSDENSFYDGFAVKTTAYYDWAKADLTSGDFRTSGDISAIISEITTRAGWSSGNSIAFVTYWTGNYPNGNDLVYRSYDYSGNVYGAKLDITYSTATTPTVGIKYPLPAFSV